MILFVILKFIIFVIKVRSPLYFCVLIFFLKFYDYRICRIRFHNENKYINKIFLKCLVQASIK